MRYKENLNYSDNNIIAGKNDNIKNKGKNELYKSESPEGNIIYSLQSYKYAKEDTLMKDLKNLDSEEVASDYLLSVIDTLEKVITLTDFDYIVQVPSSSKFLAHIYKLLLEMFDLTVPNITITKNPIDCIYFNMDLAEKKVKPENIKEMEIMFYKILNRMQQTDGKFISKKFFKPLLKFVSGLWFIDSSENIEGKNILVLDDNFAIGETIKAIVDQFSSEFNAKVIGLTLFKFT